MKKFLKDPRTVEALFGTLAAVLFVVLLVSLAKFFTVPRLHADPCSISEQCGARS